MTAVIGTDDAGIYDDEEASSLNQLRRAMKGDNTMFGPYAAIDPLALIFTGAQYAILVEHFHPHVPKVAQLQQALESMTLEERQFALARAKALVAYGEAVMEAAAELAR